MSMKAVSRMCMGILTLFCCVHVSTQYVVDQTLEGQRVVGSALLPLIMECPAALPIPCGTVISSEPRVTITEWTGFSVLCDTQSDGGGWLIIQRRTNGEVDFFRNWEDYKVGFGNTTGDFWLGNEKIHRLTTRRRFELRVDMKYNGNDYYASYSHFRLYGEDENYRLDVSGYTGNAGDNLAYHNNMQFSTKDRDNDRHSGNCAVLAQGAWWYNNCHMSNLNGLWGSRTYAFGLNWRQLTDTTDSVTFSEMKIRPVT